MKRLLAWKPSLLASFSILGGILTVVIAVVLALGLQNQLERNALQQEAATAADQALLDVGPNISATDLSAPLNPARFAEIDMLIHRDVMDAHVVRVKIWNPAGLLTYSDDPSEAGKSYPLTDELHNALGGEIATEVSTLTKAENVGERGLASRLLEVYVPIRLGGSSQVVGAFEIYHDLTVLDPIIVSTNRFVEFSICC